MDDIAPSLSVSASADTSATQTAMLLMSDEGSGMAYYYAGKDLSGITWTECASGETDVTIDSDGTWYFIAKDAAGNTAQDEVSFVYLSLDADGGTVPLLKILKAEGTSPAFPDAQKTGYTFTGWEETGENAYTAQYEANTYTVTLNANGGSVSTASVSATYGSPYGDLPEPSRAGYDFTGWYTTASGGTRVDAATIFQTAGNVTLYAHWAAASYTITFNYGSYGKGSVASAGVTYGSTYPTLPTVTTTSTSYTFMGWYTASSGGTLVSSGDKVAVTADTTLYAVYVSGTTSFTDSSGHEIFTYSLNNSSMTMTITGLTSYGLKLESITIPPSYTVGGKTYAVTSFTWTYGGSNSSSSPNKTLKEFTIADEVASAGGYSFHNVNNVGMGDSAFKNCTSLTTFDSGDGLSEIPSGMFYGCTALKYVTIGSSVAKIGMYAFQGCTGLQYIVIPDTVTDMSAGMQFKGCTGLKAVYFSKNATVRSMSSTADCAYAVFTQCNHSFALYIGKSSAAAYGNSYWHCYTGNTEDGYTPSYPSVTASSSESKFRSATGWTY